MADTALIILSLMFYASGFALFTGLLMGARHRASSFHLCVLGTAGLAFSLIGIISMSFVR